MDVENNISKILNPVEKHSVLIGAAGAFIPQIGGWTDNIQRLLAGEVHAPEWQNILANTFQQPNLTALIAAVAGYFIKGATNNRMIEQFGKILEGVGIGYFIVNEAGYIVYFSTHSPGSGSTLGSSSSAAWAPNTQAYQSIYGKNPTSGSFYTQVSGSRLQGN